MAIQDKNPPRVNYDAVASRYDQRVQGTYLAGAIDALQKLAHQLNANCVLDLGCGTGRSLQGFVQMEPRPICYGLDFSSGMLRQARQLEPDYRLVNASAPQPPFVDGCFDLVCCTLAFHHFPDKQQVVQRAFDMLRPGGAFAIVNINPHQSGQSWPVYDFFEGVYEADLERFPSLAAQESMLAQVGFQQISSRIVEHIFHQVVGEAILDNYHIRKEACSQLILISDKAYQIGLDRIRARLAEAKSNGEEVVFRTDLKNYMCHGFKP